MRALQGIVIGCLLVTVPACASNNKGKIVGKWESVPGSVPNGGVMTLDFTAEGTMTMTVGIQGMVLKTITGKYSLGMGDAVTLSNLSEAISGHTSHRETITITGTQMVMKDSDGKSVTFKKL